MGSVGYDRFVRVLTRCAELAAAPGKPAIIGHVYKASAEAPITAFLEADKAVTKALTAFAKENREALAALNALDRPYATARSAVVAVLPESVLPETLKAQPTDTDKLNAIEELLDIIDENVGTPWADELLQGEFGQKAPQTVKEVNEAIQASSTRGDAITDRARAYGPAHEAYLSFKRVVRNAVGPGSQDYRRIHLRASAKKDEPAAPAAEATSAAPGGPVPEPAAPPAPQDADTPPTGE